MRDHLGIELAWTTAPHPQPHDLAETREDAASRPELDQARSEQIFPV